MKFKVGDRVIGEDDNGKFEGTVYYIYGNEKEFHGTIKRDDRKWGSGEVIKGYGAGWFFDEKRNSYNLKKINKSFIYT
jgi:hypothetical protein